jgi:transposase
MAKTFREWNVQQHMPLPPSVLDFAPRGHLAHFVRDTMTEELDLSAIVEVYEEERGYPPYHPVMMTALLLYAYCQRIYSSRRIARACEERVDFMAVTALQRPDFRTITTFRRRHLPALRVPFHQVVGLCHRAGVVRPGHVALDGTKIRARASKRRAMSYRRMQEAEPALAADVARWLAEPQAGAPPNAAARAARAGGRATLPPDSLLAATRARVKRAGHRSRYRLRKITVEPVFAQIKAARGFRPVAIAHNMLKLAAARTP